MQNETPSSTADNPGPVIRWLRDSKRVSYLLQRVIVDDKLVETLCSDCDDPNVTDKEGYARHLIVSALAFIHGWASR